jgi:FdhE protein
MLHNPWAALHGLPKNDFSGEALMSPTSNMLTPEGAAERISRAIEGIRRQPLPLENILKPFEEIFIARARLRAELHSDMDLPVKAPDPARFESGAPLTSEEALAISSEADWAIASDRILSALERGFPKISDEIRVIREALSDGTVEPRRCQTALAGGRDDDLAHIASTIGVGTETLRFALGQVMKPIIERKAEGLAPLIAGLRWHRGYCPLCGSMPELSFLKGDEGQRWLRCSLCGHSWRFVRLACPFCEMEKHESLQVYYIAGREQERVEVCNECGRYVPCLDLRGRFDGAVLEVAALGLVHLDLLAQEKGHLPAALCSWNIVRGQDITSWPAGLGTSGEKGHQTC